MAIAASGPQLQLLTASSEWPTASAASHLPHSNDVASVPANGATHPQQQQRRTSLAAQLALGSSADLIDVAQPLAASAADHAFSSQPQDQSVLLLGNNQVPAAQESQVTSAGATEATTTHQTIAAAALAPPAAAADCLPNGTQLPASEAEQASAPVADMQTTPPDRQLQAANSGQRLAAPVSSRDQQLHALVAEAQSHAVMNGDDHVAVTNAAAIHVMPTPPRSLLQQAAARVAAATLNTTDEWLQQSDVQSAAPGTINGAGSITTAELVTPALPVPLLLAHVLDELIAPVRIEPLADRSASVPSRPPLTLSNAALRRMARTLGEAMQRGHTLKGGRETLLQSDMKRVCDSIQRALRWLLVEGRLQVIQLRTADQASGVHEQQLL